MITVYFLCYFNQIGHCSFLSSKRAETARQQSGWITYCTDRHIDIGRQADRETDAHGVADRHMHTHADRQTGWNRHNAVDGFAVVCCFDADGGGGLMSVQPTTSFVLTQPPQPTPGSLVLTHPPGLVLSQPVGPEPPDTAIVLGRHAGASVPASFVLTQPAAPQPGAFVLSQPSAAPIGQLVLPEIAIESAVSVAECQAGPVLSPSTIGRSGTKFDMPETRPTPDVSVYHIPSGSLQPATPQQDSVSFHLYTVFWPISPSGILRPKSIKI